MRETESNGKHDRPSATRVSRSSVNGGTTSRAVDCAFLVPLPSSFPATFTCPGVFAFALIRCNGVEVPIAFFVLFLVLVNGVGVAFAFIALLRLDFLRLTGDEVLEMSNKYLPKNEDMFSCAGL